MATTINEAIIAGHLGQDPKVSYTQSGTAVANFSVATEERTKQGGEWTSQTEWHRIVVWGKTAEFCGQYLKKGSFVTVRGPLQTRKWTDQQGNDRYVTEVRALTICAPNPSGGGRQQRQGPQQDQPQPDGGSAPVVPTNATESMDDVPF